MAPAREAAHSSRQSWRGVTAPSDPQAARRVRRVLWSSAGVALLGCFAWLLIHYSRPGPVARLVCLAVADYDVLEAPPLPFAQETLADFGVLGERQLAELSLPQDVTTSSRWRSYFIRELPHKIVEPDRDVLIVYLAAHGVTQPDADGDVKAWLLCSNYDPIRKTGMYLLDDLLAALRSCGGQTKLLVLDSGAIEADLALGMAANEFPSLLKQKVSKFGDPNLWVLASHDAFEHSHAAYSGRRSVFGHYVARGLAGAADENADGVDLAELFSYVRSRVARYVWQASAEEETQTPQLLAAGSQSSARTLTLAGQRKLTPYRPAPPEASPAAKEQAQPATEPSKTAAWRSRADARGTTLALLQATSPPATPADEAAKPQPADAKAPATTTPANSPSDKNDAASKPLDAASSGDEKASPANGKAAAKTPDAAQPADSKLPAAAQPGRSPLEQLLYEQWLKMSLLADRQSNVWTPVDYAPHLWLRSVELLKGYELQRDRGASPASDTARQRLASVWNDLDLNERRQRFEASAARTRIEQNRDLLAAVHLRNDLCFRLRYYIPWAAGDGEEAAGEISALLDDLAELMQQLRDPPAAGAGGKESPGARPWLAGLRDLHDRLTDRLALVEARWRSRVAAALAPGDAARRNVFAVEPLLELPWLSAADRLALLDRLQRALALDAVADRDAPADHSRLESRTRQRAFERARLEWRRLQLAGASVVEGASEKSQEAVVDDERTVSSMIAALRRIGAQLAEAERLLTGTVQLNSGGEGESRRRAAEDLLRLAEARGAQRLDGALRIEGIDPPTACPYPDFGIAWALALAPIKPAANSPGGSPAALEVNAAATVAWRLQAAPPAPVKALWSLDYDRSLLEVSPAAGGELELAADRNDASLEFAVKPKAETGRLTSLVLRVVVGDRSATDRIEVRLPSLDPVELVLGKPNGLAGAYERFDDRRPPKIVLHPLASGGNVFQLALRNPAGRERKIEYRLLALDRTGVPDAMRAAWPLTPAGELAAGFKPLYPGPQTLTIPAQQTIPLPLPPLPLPPLPAAPPAKEKPSAGEQPSPGADPAAAAGPPATPIPDGLLCEFVDVSTQPPGAPQWYWLAVAPLHPRQYLAEPVVKYDWDDKRIEISIRPRDASLLPAKGAKVKWRCEDPLLREATPSTIEGIVTREAPELELFAAVEPLKDRPLEVLLDVDGYPRAFLYDVWCDRPRGAAPGKVVNFAVLNILEPEANPTWLADGSPVTLKLRLDVPPGWFDEPGRLLKTGILGDERQIRQFSSDRLFDVRLLPAAAPGELAIETSVGDLEATFATMAHPNQDIELAAELIGADQIDQRTVKLDRDPPVLQLARVNPKAVQGQELVVQIPVSDARSRVAKVEIGIDREGTGELKQPVQAALSKTGKDIFVATLPVKELPVGEYTGLVRAVDLVGNASKAAKFPFEIVAPGGGPEKKTARFNGKVLWNGRAGKGFTVEATGPKNDSAKADSQGAFSFAELPPGEYKLTFKGVINNKEVEFTEPLTIAQPTAKPQEKTFNGR